MIKKHTKDYSAEPSAPLRIGITGGIGSGKTLVCAIFKKQGIPVYNADARAKWLVNNDADLMDGIRRAFGSHAYREGRLDRDYMAGEVFDYPDRLKLLNSIVHPAVGEDYRQWVARQSAHYVIKEAAVLFESGSFEFLDKIVSVSAPEHVRIARVLKRDPFRSKEEIKRIMQRQWSEERRNSRSDYIIFNDESTLIVPEILRLHRQFMQDR